MTAEQSGDKSTRDAGLLTTVVGALGGVAAIVGFLFWCEQSGYYGAFSVRLDQVGIVGGAGVQLSLAAAMVSIGLAILICPVYATWVLLMATLLFFRDKTRLNTCWDRLRSDRTWVVITLVGLLLIAALVYDSIEEDSLWPLKNPLLGIVAATTVALVGWHHAWYRGPHAIVARIATVVVVIGCLGFATNAWCYQVGIHARDQDPARFGYAVGMTSPRACVTWHDTETVPADLRALLDAGRTASLATADPKEPKPWRAPQSMLLLGESDDARVLYNFDTRRVYVVPKDDASVDVRPHSLNETDENCQLLQQLCRSRRCTA